MGPYRRLILNWWHTFIFSKVCCYTCREWMHGFLLNNGSCLYASLIPIPFHNTHAFMLFVHFKLAVFQQVSTPKFRSHFFSPPFYISSQYFIILTILNQSQIAKLTQIRRYFNCQDANLCIRVILLFRASRVCLCILLGISYPIAVPLSDPSRNCIRQYIRLQIKST
jgi:hypothetical protein